MRVEEKSHNSVTVTVCTTSYRVSCVHILSMVQLTPYALDRLPAYNLVLACYLSCAFFCRCCGDQGRVYYGKKDEFHIPMPIRCRISVRVCVSFAVCFEFRHDGWQSVTPTSEDYDADERREPKYIIRASR